MVSKPAAGGRLIRVGFTMIGGAHWTGGYQYLLNLLRVVSNEAPGRITPVIFFGDDVDAAEVAPFREIRGAEIVSLPAFRARRRSVGLARAICFGGDSQASAAFATHRVDVVFEAAHFFGARLGRPAVAWLPDFQHRYLRHLFSTAAYWKRELGFRAQVAAGRTLMLSSEDSRRACETHYPASAGRTAVVRFAVPPPAPIDPAAARRVADGYDLPAHFFYLPNQFWQHKNHALVIEALAALRASGRSDVVVAASGNTRDPRRPQHYEELLARAAATGVTSQFRTLGMVPREHLAMLMMSADALLNPSLFEGWSTTVEEARALGVPLILSDLDVHREQAGTDASFFARNSAAELAAQLAGFQPLDAQARHERVLRAAAAAAPRLRAFALEFVTLIESAARPRA